MAFHYKDCFIQYHAKTDGTPAQGYVEFKPNTVLVDSDTGLILNDQTIDAYLDADGKVTVSLLACDSPGITPTDWSWNIEEKIDGGSVWWFQITDSMEEPINLKDLYIPGEAPPTIGVQGPKGDTGDQGAKGETGATGPQGPAGQAAVIVGSFSRDPAELPPDGLVPADWDSPGKPAQDHQFVPGEAVHHTPTGHLWSFVGVDILPAGWQDVGLIVGATGPQGPPGPLGPEDIIGGTGITVTENETNGTVTISSTGVADHGQLAGLADDDHTQYHNNTRGDARYDAKGTANSAVAAHVAAADPHTQYLTAQDVIPPEIAVVNDAPTEETITLWIDPDAPDYSGVGLTDLDARFVNVTGDTMTGPLFLTPINPSDPELRGEIEAHESGGLSLLTRDQNGVRAYALVAVPNNIAAWLPFITQEGYKAYNGFGGGLVFEVPKDGVPTLAQHAVTKGYVDTVETTVIPITGAGWTGTVTAYKNGRVVSIMISVQKSSAVGNFETISSSIPAGLRPQTFTMGAGVHASLGTGPFWFDVTSGGLLQAAGSWNTWPVDKAVTGIVTYVQTL